MQIAAWFRGEDYKSIPQPPFHVNRTPDEGISWLTVRAFPVEERMDEKSQIDLAAQIPYEKITCMVNTLIDEINNFTVTKNARWVFALKSTYFRFSSFSSFFYNACQWCGSFTIQIKI